ncbi:hypothetical protein [Streptomyces sp. FH025]|uniref:hypothetical protein n=1 Tax=Streptomyces sp. FH025 TaxID=2815937 RepID=UPI001A9D0FB1|nr:hypothetical protein [Streptomyces sp. FH025]MBO1418019.1 hypothetical protein [Streptomyces sp. FH025]
MRLRLRAKHRPFSEGLHPRDDRGRFARGPGAGLNPLLERIRAAASRPSRAPRSEPRFDEEQHGLVFRDGQSGRVAKAYKANVVEGITRDLRDMPDEALLLEHDRVWLDRVRSGEVHAYEDPATGIANSVWPGDSPEDSSWTHVDADRARELLRRDAVHQVIATWAMTSNDEHAGALALQETARDAFGLYPAADWPSTDQIARVTADHRAAFGTGHAAMLAAMWERTQNHLAEAHLGSLTVWRGVATPDGRPPAGSTVDGSTLADPLLRPLSAFSLDPDQAYGFATAEGPGFVMSGIVPAGRVIATPVTGLGCLDESEVIILAGPGTWHWQPAE